MMGRRKMRGGGKEMSPILDEQRVSSVDIANSDVKFRFKYEKGEGETNGELTG